MKLLKLALSCLIFFFTLKSYAENDAAIRTEWGYLGNNGPAYWWQLSPEFLACLKGKLQSPINIPKKTTPASVGLSFEYHVAPLSIVNDGTTTLLLNKTQTIINDGHGVQVNFNHSLKESIIFNGDKYELVQFHIHTPSENQWRGQTYPLEIHFVHQGKNGKVLVVGVLAQNGEPNSELQKIVNNLPKSKGKPFEIAEVTINPDLLLPKKQDYYHFTGSLTTPPCSENIKWILLAHSISVSSAQVLLLKKAIGGVNARPVQPLNKRMVSYSSTP